MTVLVCGEALYDFFQVAEKRPGELDIQARMGGSPFNVAVGLARRGVATALLTGISTDLLGERLIRSLIDEGVGTDYVLRRDQRTTLSLVGLDESGGPSYAFYGEGTADCSLTPADMPALSDDIQALHFGSYSIAVRPVADALAALASLNATKFISLDPNVRPTIEPNMQIWRDRIDAMRQHSNLIKVSAEDIALLYPGAAPADVLNAWANGPADLVIMTDGARPVTAIHRGVTTQIQPPVQMVVDTVGAGDAFQAALLSALCQTSNPAVAIRELTPERLMEHLLQAAEAGAQTCAHQGAHRPL